MRTYRIGIWEIEMRTQKWDKGNRDEDIEMG